MHEVSQAVSRLTLLALTASLAIGCTADVPVGPDTGATSPVRANQALVADLGANDRSDQYVVEFRGRVPSGFADQVGAAGGSVLFAHDIGFALVSGLTPEAAAEIGNGGRVSSILLDESFYLNPIGGESNLQSAGAGVASPGDPTAAFFYPRQWNMRAIGADMAWADGKLGSAGVTLAILDSGIDYGYPDLIGRVDLSRSISFVPFDDQWVDAFFPGRHHVTDLNWHGTHVAATAVSNGLVTAGVSSQTTLIGVKVCDLFGSCSLGSIISGVLYAADNGADVMNLSLEGTLAKAHNGWFVGFLNRVFNYARSKGVTIVVAAGNDASDLDHDRNGYHSYCSTAATICVSATGPTATGGINGPWTAVDAPALYTNFGRSAINVAAPGGTAAGAVWAACSQTSLVIPDCQSDVYVLGAGGTSMASPHVAGTAALLVAEVGRNPGQVRAILQQTAEDLGQRGTDPFYGKGRLFVYGALNR